MLHGGGRGGGWGGRCGLRLHLGIVFLDQRLDALLRVAAGGQQILVCLLDFVLVQIELGLREIELIL